jgi:hypothetical protein
VAQELMSRFAQRHELQGPMEEEINAATSLAVWRARSLWNLCHAFGIVMQFAQVIRFSIQQLKDEAAADEM